jgi:hypothetical protein
MAKIKTKKQPEPKQLPTVTVTSKADPRLKKYQDSLNLYNASVEMGKDVAQNLSKGYHRMDLEEVKKGNTTKKEADRRYKSNLKYYNEALVDPITKGTKPKFGGISKYIKVSDKLLQANEDFYKEGLKTNKFDYGMSAGTKEEYESVLKNYKKIKSLNKNIKPISILENAELPTIPVYKKPVQPVKYEEKAKEAIFPTIVLKESDHHDIKIDRYSYDDGEPIMHNSWSGGSEFVGVKKKDGTVQYVKPEDYKRMGVSKIGQKYIESKTNNNGKD